VRWEWPADSQRAGPGETLTTMRRPIPIPDEPEGALTEAEARLGGLRDCCLFRFKHPDRMPEALRGVIKILP
jgi:hypothetical protein